MNFLGTDLQNSKKTCIACNVSLKRKTRIYCASIALFSKLHKPCARFGIRTDSNEGELQIKINEKWYSADFNFKNKIIEFYGDYWHANPTKYKPDRIISDCAAFLEPDVLNV